MMCGQAQAECEQAKSRRNELDALLQQAAFEMERVQQEVSLMHDRTQNERAEYEATIADMQERLEYSRWLHPYCTLIVPWLYPYCTLIVR